MKEFKRKPKSKSKSKPKPKRGDASKTTGSPRQSKRSKKGEGSTRRKDAKSKADASKNNTAAWAALGIGAAAAAAITAKSLASFASSDGANITFTEIKQTPWTADMFSSPKLEISWKFKDNPENQLAIPNEVTIIEGDEIDIHGLDEYPDLKNINTTGNKVVRIKDDSTFVIEAKTDRDKLKKIFGDTNSLLNKGEGTIQTSFDDRLEQTVSDTAGGIADTLGLDNIWGYMGIVVGIILACIAVYFLVQFYQSSKSAPAQS